MPKPFLNEDVIRCTKTIKLQNITIIKRGILYVAHQVKLSCCQPVIDIGFRHHTPIVHTCSCCGKVSSPSDKLFIPTHYFIKARRKQDALSRAIGNIEHHFSIVEYRMNILDPI